MKKQKRIKLKNGSARVNEDCPQETVSALEKMAELAAKAHERETFPCNNCQGGGCPTCGGSGVWII